METFDISKYIDIALRRKYWIIIPFLLTILAGLFYTQIAPKIYEAETLILVQSEKVPEDFVRAIISSDLESRLRTITQQVTSRTNLEKIIQEHQLYSKSDGTLAIDDKVNLLREKIRIDVSGGKRRIATSAFTIAFQSNDPKKAMQVTNALASNYISENVRGRESQAIGTSAFLADELDSVEKRLMDKEEQLKRYREKYMGGLPEQLDTNLRILERLQGHFEQLNSNLRDAENRKIITQQAIAEAKKNRSYVGLSPLDQGGEARDLVSLKNELASLEARYTQRHPDVIRLKKTIAKLEAEQSKVASDSLENKFITSRTGQTLISQLQDIELEINKLKADIKDTKSQINWHQTKVEQTPKREQELLTLNRDYENLRELYNSLSNRKLESDIAVGMVKKQKGDQFRVLDPAKEPTRPVEPNIPKIILLTLILGLGLGGGLGYLVETMDTSYKSPEEIEKELQVPVLVSMPIRYTEEELQMQQRKKVLKAATVALSFFLSAISIVFATKGIDTTLNYIKDVFDKI